MPFDETIVAQATPLGESAIAIVRVTGQLCQKLVSDIFTNKNITPRISTFGKYTSINNKEIDHVIFVYYENEASYTGEPMLEIFPHGNPLIVQKIIEDLVERGCRIAQPGEFTRTAFLNGKMDLSQSEAVIDLIRSRSDKALESAKKQLDGSVGHKVNELVSKLVQVIANLEAYIDFPEEDLPTENEVGPISDLIQLSNEIDQLIATSHYKSILQEGVRTVLIGLPNVGKSSLLNALTGDDRVIVSPEAGTTRDFIETRVIVEQYCLQIIDTAGLHSAKTSIEEQSISKTLEQVRRADIILFVIDSTLPYPTLTNEINDILPTKNLLIIENKIDLAESKSCSNLFKNFKHCRVSALNEFGLEDVFSSIVKIIEKNFEIHDRDAIIVSARHATALKEAKLNIRDAINKINNKIPTELIVSDLRTSLSAIETIVGSISNERILDEIFDNFCIGK